MGKWKKYTASQQLEAMASQWADNKAIMIIGGVCEGTASKIRKKIEEQVITDGYRLPKSAIVPMEYVIKYFNININYLKKLAKLERGE
jgi:hypothetical protein